MPSQFITTGLLSLEKKLLKLSKLDPTPLLVEWRGIIEEDNRRGILAGTDGWGKPLHDLISPRKGKYKGATGPPLAPFYDKSRTIANFRTAHGRDGLNYFALGAWEDVLSVATKKHPGGVQFLPFHFRGEGKLPIRGLNHIRPWGVTHARAALQTWVRTQIHAA
jgi:hypothetical protein